MFAPADVLLQPQNFSDAFIHAHKIEQFINGIECALSHM